MTITGLGIRPGIRAVIVLVGATPLAIALGVVYGRDRASCHAIALSVVSLGFWLWAVYKVVAHGAADYGVLSFALVLAAGASIRPLASASYHSTRESGVKRLNTAMCRMSIACLAPLANYVYVLSNPPPDLRPTFRVYLACGAVWWGAASVWTFTALHSASRRMANSNEEFEAGSAEFEGSVEQKFRTFIMQ